MGQIEKPIHRRRKRCQCCKKLFYPDPRTKDKQEYCSNAECQTIRQRKNESDWRKRNPDSLKDQYQQSRKWHKAHPGYSRKRRMIISELKDKNRKDTRIRMQKMRSKNMFDKSKSIMTQLLGNKGKNCYLAHGSKWLFVRLTKASLLLKRGSFWDNRKGFKSVNNRLPKGRLYDLSSIFNKEVFL